MKNVLLFCCLSSWQRPLTLSSHSSTFAFLRPFRFGPGIEAKLDSINQLKVKGLVLGPLHNVQADQPNTLDLQKIDPEQGTAEELRSVLEKAHRKGKTSENSSWVTS